MKKITPVSDLLIGLLLAALILPPSTVQAQWTVYDPAQYALQVKKRVDEANRWLVTISQYTQMYEKAVQQVTTLGGILKTTEDLVVKQRNMIATMSNIGQTVRGAYRLKQQLETLVVTRLRAFKAIHDRLRNGVFDPNADIRDFEDYLQNSIGRSSQDTVANLERLARMDNFLERLVYEKKIAQKRLADAQRDRTEAKALLDAEEAKPLSDRCASCIASLSQQISTYDLLIAQLEGDIAQLESDIETRIKKYNVVLEERVNFAQQVQSTNQAWSDFNKTKDDIQQLLDRIEGRSAQ